MSEREVELQAELIFRQCDVDNKGYLTKNDLRELLGCSAMDECQLNDVFNSLDRDRDSKLTWDEFRTGFGQYLNGTNSRESFYGPPEGSDDSFDDTIEGTGVKECLEDVELVEEIWKQVRRENPSLLPDFEKLLFRISEKLKKSKNDFQTIENEMRIRKTAHEDEVRNLYEEVENQIKMESQKLMDQEKIKERNRRLELESEIQDKDRMYQEMQNHYEQMLKRMRELESMQSETVNEKQSLAKERDLLHSRLAESESSLKGCHEYIEQLREKAREDRKNRARAVIDLNEGIALERETLVRQMEQLRELNRQLKDERDERLSFQQRYPEMLGRGEALGNIASRQAMGINGDAPGVTVEGSGDSNEAKARRDNVFESYPHYITNPNLSAETISRRGSTLAAYFGSGRSRKPTEDFENETGIIVEENDIDGASVFSSSNSCHVSPKSSVIFTGSPPYAGKRSFSTIKSESTITKKSSIGEDNLRTSQDISTSQSCRTQTSRESLQSVFKVIFIGDSAVGKTTIIKQFALGEYNPHTASTVGVDYQIKTLQLEDMKAVLQLWDTAGQEKFRSITKQYFRKADGVVVVFDMTNIESYLHVRNWMECLQDSTPEDRTIMILGNKTDLLAEGKSENSNYVTLAQGKKMADQYDALFFPVSGKTAENLDRAFVELSRKMKLLEEKERIDATQNLTEVNSKNKVGCCSGFLKTFS